MSRRSTASMVPSAWRIEGLSPVRRRALATAVDDPGGTMIPPSPTTSGKLATSVAMTGRPVAMASRAASPNPSPNPGSVRNNTQSLQA
jgi:hypothetical protein